MRACAESSICGRFDSRKYSGRGAPRRWPDAVLGLCLTVLTATAGALSVAPPAHAQGPVINDPTTVRYVKGRILVKPQAGLPEAQFDKIIRGNGGRKARAIKGIGVHIIELPAGVDETRIIKALSKNPHIKFAELDRALEPSFTPADPQYSSQWHLPIMGAPGAWNSATGNGVTIAVLDSGVDPTHPDLQAALVPGYNFYDNNTNTADVYGHGTKVAGSAAAVGNNGIGVASVAFGGKIMPMRITDPQGYGYDSLIASGIAWAADHGARVANVSFQGVAGSSTILNAAKYMRNKGGVVVVAAGNSSGLEYIAPSDLVTTASATDPSDNVASWSSYGDYVDVAAPGAGICTTTNGGGYGCVSGTSFASPVTAGVYQLMMSVNPSLQPAQLDGILFSTAKDLGTGGWDQRYGWGRIDAYAAVQKAQGTVASDTTAPTVSISSPGDGSKVSGIAAISVAASDNVGVSKVDLYVNNALLASDITAPYTFNVDTTIYADGTTLALVAKALDGAGLVGTSGGVTVTVANDTQPPTVTITNPANGSVVSGTVMIAVAATDDARVEKISLSINGKEVALSYGSSLSYSWTTSSTTSTKTKGSGFGRGGKKGSQTTQTTTGETVTITAKATDSAGNTSTASVTVTAR